MNLKTIGLIIAFVVLIVFEAISHWGVTIDIPTVIIWISAALTFLVNIIDSIVHWKENRPTLYKALNYGSLSLLFIVIVVALKYK